MDQNQCNNLRDQLNQLKKLRDEYAVELNGLKEKMKVDGGSSLVKDNYDPKKIFAEGERIENEIGELLKGGGELAVFCKEDMLPRELMKLKLKEQYESQVQVAWKSGLFDSGVNKSKNGGESLRAQNLPMIERNGKKYPMPSWVEVEKILRKPENREIIKEKSKQGFTQMLIVPFGYD